MPGLYAYIEHQQMISLSSPLYWPNANNSPLLLLLGGEACPYPVFVEDWSTWTEGESVWDETMERSAGDQHATWTCRTTFPRLEEKGRGKNLASIDFLSVFISCCVKYITSLFTLNYNPIFINAGIMKWKKTTYLKLISIWYNNMTKRGDRSRWCPDLRLYTKQKEGGRGLVRATILDETTKIQEQKCLLSTVHNIIKHVENLKKYLYEKQ